MYFFNLFIFGCAGSSLLHEGFPLVERSRGYSLVVVRGLHTAVASRFRARALQHKLDSRGAQARLPCGMEGVSGSGTEPVSTVLAGGFFTTEPSEKPLGCFFLRTPPSWSPLFLRAQSELTVLYAGCTSYSSRIFLSPLWDSLSPSPPFPPCLFPLFHGTQTSKASWEKVYRR